MIQKNYRKVVLAVAFFLLFHGNSLFAQDLTVKGIVRDNKTNEALIGVKVQVKGTNVIAGTDIDGKYSINLPSTGGSLVFTLSDYKPNEKKITASNENLEIRLLTDVYKTSEIVITGIATSVKRAESATSIGTIKGDELASSTPTSTVSSAFAGKVAGLSVMQNTGAPGGAINVNLRGISTIVGNTQPLYIIDGIIVNASEIQGGSDKITEANAFSYPAPQGQPSSRISDLNPNDIADIQVLKGPSASAMYGSQAASGVIIITTKSGLPGAPQVDVSQKSGFATVLKKLGLIQNPSDGKNNLGALVNNGGINYEDVLYGRTAFLNETNVSVKGGTKTSLLYGGASAKYEDGILRNTGYQRYNVKAGLTQLFGDKVSMDLNVAYTYSFADKGMAGNSNSNIGPIAGLVLLSNVSNLLPNAQGIYASGPSSNGSVNPVEVTDKIKNLETTNRVSSAAKIDWNIYKDDMNEIKFTASGGVDYVFFQNNINSPYNSTFEAQYASSNLAGQVSYTNQSSIYTSVFTSLIYTAKPTDFLDFRTSVGFQENSIATSSIYSQARGLSSTLNSLNSAATISSTVQSDLFKYDIGFYAQEEINLYKFVFVTGSIRGDRTSASGDPNAIYLYPRGQVAFLISSVPGFQESEFAKVVDFLKVRYAYGQAGTHPTVQAKYVTLGQLNLGGIVGLVPNSILGNPSIRPERSTEHEIGIDIGLSNIVSLEVSYYNRYIYDLILASVPAPSSGYSTYYSNAGEMSAWGFEATVGVNWYQDADWSLRSNVTFGMNRQKIEKLSVSEFIMNGTTKVGAFLVKAGYAPTTIVGIPGDNWMKANGNATTDNSYTGARVIGDANPLFRMGFGTTLKWKGLEFAFLLDWKQGGMVVNWTKDLMDGTRPEALTRPVGISRAEDMVEDASFLKLREVSLSYTFNKVFEGIRYIKLGVSGRNLLMATRYTGFDPEVSNLGSVAVGAAVDITPYPSTRSVYFSLSFGL